MPGLAIVDTGWSHILCIEKGHSWVNLLLTVKGGSRLTRSLARVARVSFTIITRNNVKLVRQRATAILLRGTMKVMNPSQQRLLHFFPTDRVSDLRVRASWYLILLT